MTTAEIKNMVAEGKIKEHHTALFRGYVSRTRGGHVLPYSGKFGKGYMVMSPNWKSSRYSYVTYFIVAQ